ncbi:phosphatase PAP2 family protein [Xylanibacillus composti]|uniref:Vanadium-dependent haloperoxidase n=1 Tax=Xylanibacillus composti TaxID=1572762 RepID=A0A8J4H636_9BACL|nr:vanadium-dependent haloperoxidase [Xylanibacillus composti]MDT9726700.1 phosphatase PAP2 family protein [Xylanibacillus composti]GIQ69368.1 vanadium-dependent haloperoxidase [Xylanibacillus composti]
METNKAGAREAESAAYSFTLSSADTRRERAYQARVEAAAFQRKQPYPKQGYNGDEQKYPEKIGSFSKVLPHNELGVVDASAYQTFKHAISTGRPEDYEAIPLGGKAKLVNPQAGLGYDLVGADCHHFALPAPPAFDSAQMAGELVELYWRALTRDIPFAEYETNALVAAAAKELSALTDYRGPRSPQGSVTPKELFRGGLAGETTGPFLSQFIYGDFPYGGALTVQQKYRVAASGSDHLTQYDEWLAIQNGSQPQSPQKLDATPRYLRTGRDLASLVHTDFSYQIFLTAALILLRLPQEAIDRSNPYVHSSTQAGFATFGGPHILELVAAASKSGLAAAWYQKFQVHRRVRPEAYAGYLHLHKTGRKAYPFHNDLLQSRAATEVSKKFGTYLLPMAYPEGCPAHPSYPGGHSSIAGACTTVLKAFFHESYELPRPVQPSKDGLSLEPYTGPALTIGGELNKLAANVAYGRDTAGVHWRSDEEEGLKLGEAAAIRLLQDYSSQFHEAFSGFTFTKFDGTTVTI